MFIGMVILSLLFGGMIIAFEYLLKGEVGKTLICLVVSIMFFNITFSCGVEEIPAPPIEEPTCNYFLDGLCVSEEEGINIDKEMLSRSLAITERRVNSFYPGLDLTTLAEEKNLSLHFSWDFEDTNLRGVYTDHNTTSRVFIRTGEVSKQTLCKETYYVAMHEVLHFVVSRHIEYNYGNDDPHMIPGVFIWWEMTEAYRHARDPSYLNIAEGLIYLDIEEECMSL